MLVESERQASRQCVIVLGMHRSATSALAGVLVKLGCAAPADDIGPGVGNSKGHWESQGCIDLNDRILASAGTSWHSWLPLNSDWFASPLYEPMVRKARDVIEESYPNEPLFVLKDPRICRVPSLWQKAMADDEIRASLVFIIRNPHAVARSLYTRDNMSLSYGLLLWLRYVLDAEAYTRGHPRSFLQHDGFFGDWRKATQKISDEAGIIWPRRSIEAEAEIDDYLSDAKLDGPITGTATPDWVRTASDIFTGWASAAEDPADYAKLDEVRAALDASAGIFSQMTRTTDQAIQAGAGDALREELTRRVDEAAAKNASLAGQLANEQATRQAEVSEIAAARQADSEAHKAEMAALQAEVERLTTEVDAANRALSERSHLLSVSESTLRQREEEIAQARAGLERIENDIVQYRLTEEESEKERARLSEAIRQLESAVADANAWVFNLADERAKSQAEVARVKREYELLRREIGALAQDNDALQFDKKVLIDSLRKAESEIGLLKTSVEKERADATTAASAFETKLNELRNEVGEVRRQATHETTIIQAESDERARDTAVVTRLLAEAEVSRDIASEQRAWLSDVTITMRRSPWWWAFLPLQSRRKRQCIDLKERGLFDGDAYVQLYRDVAEAGHDPLQHYIRHGMAEGRTLTR